MNILDAPTRSYCVVKRQKTNTPLQSLAMLNDPQFVEASRVLAQKTTLKFDQPTDQLEYIYRSLTSRTPENEELELLGEFYSKQFENFTKADDAASGWLDVGEMHVTATDRIKLAALTVTASMVLNSDAAIMKR